MEKVNFKDYNSPFATRLRVLMDERNVKRIELAELLGVSRQSIGQYCDGTSLPPADKIIVLADYFDVSTDYLLGRTDVKTVDVNVQGVCGYTGLSEKAVENLHIICIAELKRLLKTINFLIEEEVIENKDYCIMDGEMSARPSGERFLTLFFSIAEFFSTSIDDDVELVIHRNDVGIVDKDSDWFERMFNVGSIKAKDVVDVSFMNSIRGKLMKAKEKYIAEVAPNGKHNKEE